MLFQLSPVVLAAAIGLLPFSVAQFPPPVTYSSVIKSPIDPNITISYKSPDPGTCTTVFTSQKQYTGYVELPPFTIAPYQQNYSINTFFWFIEARQNPETAPLTIWLNGGPGSSSMIGLFQESGPCEVVEMSDGTYGTQSRMWGWDRSSNVLYFDQPAQVGFSYDILVNKSHDLLTDTYSSPGLVPSGQPSCTFLNGTFSSGNPNATANTTNIAASATWHFLQGFLAAFPQYNPGTRPNSTTVSITGIHLFAESYGGQYGPAFANLFEQQNAKRVSGALPRNSTLEIKLTSLGIINGIVDDLVQLPYYPKFANNNTYGIEAIDTVTYLNALSDFNAPGGCKEAVIACRNSMNSYDPNGEGDETATNQLCTNAQNTCYEIEYAYSASNRNYYDVRELLPSSFPNSAYLEYLNYASVQKSIGARVNYTESNSIVFAEFSQTGDLFRGTQLASLANLLSLGVRVAFIYGDADYICNWEGGEAVSLALAAQSPTYTTAFPAAGYADIIVNSSYVGGAVRQFGNLSFSRIYDSGHFVPAYQPETAFTVFTRIIQGTDVGTGEPISLSTFATKGPQNATHTNKVPTQAPNVCWIRALSSCSSSQVKQLSAGQGVVINGVWYQDASDYNPPSSSVIAGIPGSLPANQATASVAGTARGTASTSSVQVTGVYVATGTPTPTSGAISMRLATRKSPSDLNNVRWPSRLPILIGIQFAILVFVYRA
ncbi:carboxypeptidase S1 [Lepidopterella palustris CBS 459.81]|uniref:Carboxypeptidase n=1 Tax=Lepidopterella palustris CBS 459.81 TaxID=1314670 RepID=A0A8E2E9I7_9PEZI|nr:carboxypeptidase S1 [Lepidopterella palustris CBS 459.81]